MTAQDADADIWDRVRSLSPSCPPRKGRMFPRIAPTLSLRAGTGEVATMQTRADPPVPAASAWAKLPVAAALQNGRAVPFAVRGADPDMAATIDLLRTRLVQTLRENGWRRVAIASPSPECGSTMVAASLAASLARVGSMRTILFDLNLRRPGIARSFGVKTDRDIRRFLTGQVPPTSALVRYAENVALGLTRAAPGDADISAELLQDGRAGLALGLVEQALAPDLVLFDLPPMLAYDDTAALLPQVDGVLLVADGTKTTAREIAECERAIAGHTKLLGVVLNRARDGRSLRQGY